MAVALIPAAGFGLRVGSPPAKELLLNPSGEPMVNFAIRAAIQCGMRPVVITREEKQLLIRYLENHDEFQKAGGKIRLTAPTREWPETLLAAESDWANKNFVFLPDTQWEPLNILEKAVRALDKVGVAVGVHRVSDVANWGRIQADRDGITVYEKIADHSNLAWGFFGFQKSVGQALLTAQLESTLNRKPIRVGECTAEFIELSSFTDLTRA